MEIFILLIGVPIAIGLLAAFGLSALAIVGYIIAGAFALLLNFWYLALAVLLIMAFPVLYLDGWLTWILIVFAVIVALVVIFDRDSIKAEIERQRVK